MPTKRGRHRQNNRRYVIVRSHSTLHLCHTYNLRGIWSYEDGMHCGMYSRRGLGVYSLCTATCTSDARGLTPHAYPYRVRARGRMPTDIVYTQAHTHIQHRTLLHQCVPIVHDRRVKQSVKRKTDISKRLWTKLRTKCNRHSPTISNDATRLLTSFPEPSLRWE